MDQAAQTWRSWQKAEAGGPCAPPDGHLLSVGGVCGVRGRCQREGDSCPTGAGGGDPLIEAVREAGIEIRLEGHGAAADKPGAVLLLRAEEVLHSLLICAVGDRQAGGLQSHPVSYTHLRAHETGRNLVC